jgi:hypothetical protein
LSLACLSRTTLSIGLKEWSLAHLSRMSPSIGLKELSLKPAFQECPLPLALRS